ncbi:MAG: CoA transferase [Alphaproteobacteria bacterium]|nr:CoA transferase [Alphaproteobacteria bacterium]MBU0798496.1 CoA transferase [Alphaproteobacteria bacterium]MBU0888305.1 CoA transferase [Alphaproteobacteria bacterium]MBU1812864.1 CoA transferase [Alphaproteobacteria bacterium]
MLDLLQGIKVVSFNHFLLGPVSMQALADMGADVISIEPLEGAFQRQFGGGVGVFVDGQASLFLTGNRNKRSIALDLKSEKGREIARKLAESADVVCENFRPGVMEKLGLGYEALKQANPGLIYAAASGYGADGPYAEKPGQDLLIQAMSGLATITGEAVTGPRAVGVSVADHHGAALLAMGILGALLRRTRTGKGCRVDVNLLSAAIDLQMESFINFLNADRKHDVAPPHRIGGWYYAAPYGIYPVQDGHIAISLGSLKALGEAMESLEIAAIPDAEAFDRREEVVVHLDRLFPTRPFAEWAARLEARKLWYAKVNDYDAVAADPQVKHNGTFVTVEGATGAPITLVNHPVRYDGQAAEVKLPPQKLGANTAEILSELGYSNEDISEMSAGRSILLG